jgi:scyllo-inositol 2-dehydrogenase (NADP+)
MKKLRIGVVGMGRMGITHTAILKQNQNVEVCALADPSRLMRRAFGRFVGLSCYTDYNEMLKSESLDCIVVCTPPHLHEIVARKGLEFGCHAFVEKPLTAKSSSAFELAELFEGRGMVNQVGYVNRFNDVFGTVRKMVQVGVIGRVSECHSTMLSGTVLKHGSGGWRGSKHAGGGVIFEMASHAVNLMHFMVGPFGSVENVVKKKIYSLEVEDAVTAELVGENGCKGYLNVNWSDESVRKPTNRLKIVGEGGEINANQHGMTVTVDKEYPEFSLMPGENSLEITDLFKPVGFYLRGNEFTSQLFHFVNCVSKGETKTNCSFRDGAETLRILELLDNA